MHLQPRSDLDTSPLTQWDYDVGHAAERDFRNPIAKEFVNAGLGWRFPVLAYRQAHRKSYRRLRLNASKNSYEFGIPFSGKTNQ